MKIKYVLQQIIHVFLNPISPIIILLIGFIISLLTDKDYAPKKIISWINEIDFRILIFVLLLWFITTICYIIVSSKIKQKDKKIQDLNSRLNEKNRQIENNSAIIYNKYSELAKFNKHQKLIELLKLYVNENVVVQSAQIYSYSTKIIKKCSKKEKVEIKVQFVEGYAYEDVDVNCLLQSYYSITKNTYFDTLELINAWKEIPNISTKPEIYDIYLDNLEKKGDKLIGQILKSLNRIKKSKDINNYHSVLYRILLVTVGVLYTFDSGFIIDSILKDKNIEEKLIDRKRTGILGAILLQDRYLFRHTGCTSKNGRIYSCVPFNLQGESYILLLTLPAGQLNIDLDSQLDALEEDFSKRICLLFNNNEV